MGAPESSRIRREDCSYTKHDLAFSKWEILIGPTDWEDHRLGKEGIERYRIHNLPISSSCPGLYELGITASHAGLGRKIRNANPNCIVVVYLGQADNVRTRLQHYGRAGSHLDHGNSLVLSNEETPLTNTRPCLQRGLGLFREIFSRGFPIMFRWAPMENKKEAERTEARLLGIFDYAWNKDKNGARRPNDILLKLDKIFSEPGPFSGFFETFQHWKWRDLRKKREGITINHSNPVKETESNLNDLKHDLGSQIFKFGRSRPRLVAEKFNINEDQHVCGVALGDGTVCKNRPVAGRKRCGEHKGKRINGLVEERKSDADLGTQNFKFSRSRPILITGKCSINEDQHACGVALGDGTICKNSPVAGRKRCSEHKGQRINGLVVERDADLGSRAFNFGGLMPRLIIEKCIINEDQHVCGVALGDGTVCKNSPLAGRKRCNEHKGKRINGLVVERKSLCVCGVGLEDGSICTKIPVQGRKRCEKHKGKRVP